MKFEFILFGILFLFGCGASDASIQYGDYNVFVKGPEEKENSEIMDETFALECYKGKPLQKSLGFCKGIRHKRNEC